MRWQLSGIADGGRRRKTFSEKLLERRDFVTMLGEPGFCSFVLAILPPGPPVRSGGRGLAVGRQHETRWTSWGKTHLEAERLSEHGTVFYSRRDFSSLETSRLWEARGLKKGSLLPLRPPFGQPGEHRDNLIARNRTCGKPRFQTDCSLQFCFPSFPSSPRLTMLESSHSLVACRFSGIESGIIRLVS